MRLHLSSHTHEPIFISLETNIMLQQPSSGLQPPSTRSYKDPTHLLQPPIDTVLHRLPSNYAMSCRPLINYPCTLCCRPTSMWCSRCQKSWYCSPEHLQSDWPRHRKECLPASNQNNMIATPPPAEPQVIKVSAILFSPEEERPRIISIDCLPSLATKEGSAPMPLLDAYMPEGRPEGIVLTQGLSGEPLRFPLHVWYSPTALSRCKPVNRSIYHITSGAARKAWCGTVVVLKFNGSRRLGYSDAGSNDLPALSAYFLAYK